MPNFYESVLGTTAFMLLKAGAVLADNSTALVANNSDSCACNCNCGTSTEDEWSAATLLGLCIGGSSLLVSFVGWNIYKHLQDKKMQEIRTGNQREIMAEFQEMKRKMDGDSLPHGVSKDYKDSHQRFVQSQRQLSNEYISNLRRLDEFRRSLLREKIGRKIESEINGLEIEKIKLGRKLDKLRNDKEEVEAKQPALSDGNRGEYEAMLRNLYENIDSIGRKIVKKGTLVEKFKKFVTDENNIKQLINSPLSCRKLFRVDFLKELERIISRYNSRPLERKKNVRSSVMESPMYHSDNVQPLTGDIACLGANGLPPSSPTMMMQP